MCSHRLKDIQGVLEPRDPPRAHGLNKTRGGPMDQEEMLTAHGEGVSRFFPFIDGLCAS